MSHSVSVWLSKASADVSQQAAYLGGEQVDEREIAGIGIEQIFNFNSIQNASNFQFDAHYRTEVISTERSPYRSVIDASALCKCALKTVSQCSHDCEHK
jgi:hypothetical protein